jgi:curli biogenesis system outer membrane secretion channel CsgG
MMAFRKLMGLALASLVVTSCSGPRSYLNPDADRGYYRRVGVAAFESLSDDARAGLKLQRILLSELLKRQEFDLAPQGQFEKIETEVRSKQSLNFPTPLDSTALAMIAQQTGAQGIIIGTVRDYRMERVGQEEFPMVAFSLKLVDAPTGRVVWDVSVGERGGPKFPVFSFGETHTLSELATKLCRKALGTLR